MSTGRAASRGALATELPRATRSQPESIRTVFCTPESIRIVPPKHWIFHFFRIQTPSMDEVEKNVEFSRLNSKPKWRKKRTKSAGEKFELSQLNSNFGKNLSSTGWTSNFVSQRKIQRDTLLGHSMVAGSDITTSISNFETTWFDVLQRRRHLLGPPSMRF